MAIVERLVAARSRELARVMIRERKSQLAQERQAARSRRRAGGRRKQLCPVPGCENAAAPIFGMTCREHKDLPTAVIKKYRAERRGDFSHLLEGASLAPMTEDPKAPLLETTV